MAAAKMQTMLTSVRQKLMVPIIAKSEGYLFTAVDVSVAEVGLL
jgi:hypothetical protein